MHTGGHMAFKRFAYFVAWMLLTIPIAFAQSTVVSGNITDPGGNVWINATVTAQFAPTPNTPGPYSWVGGALVQQPAPVQSDNSGNFTITLPSNNAIVPSGSSWIFIISPNATQAAATANIALSGGTLNIIPIITASGGWPTGNVPGTFVNKVYNTTQVGTVPLNVGAIVYNTTLQELEFWNGSSWAAIGTGGGGSGSVLASPQFQIAFYPTAGSVTTVQGSAKATTDGNGNVRFLSTNGNPDAYESQTNPTSNNGIFNALQSGNTIVVAGQDYPITEYESYGGNCNAPEFFTGFFILRDCGFADNTAMISNRPLSSGRLDYNSWVNNFPPYIYNKNVRLNNADGYLQSVGGYVDAYIAGCCSPPSNGFSQNQVQWRIMNMQDLTGGISGEQAHVGTKYAPGDFHLLELDASFDGNTQTNSDEGGAIERTRAIVDNFPFFGTLTTNVAAGNNVFPITPDSNSIYSGTDKIMIDATKRIAVVQVSAIAGGNFPNPETLTIPNTTFTPDLKCLVTSTVSVDGKIKGGTTSTTFGIGSCINTASGQSFPVANNLALPLCIATIENVQSVKVTAATSSSVTALLNVGVEVGDPIYQGPQACIGASIDANHFGAYSNITRIAGCPASHSCDLISINSGFWTSGTNGAFNTFSLANGVTMTRDGAGHVSVPITFADTAGLFYGANINVTSASVSNFNGVHKVLTDDGVSPISTITWADSGSAGTATTSALSYFVAGNGVQANQLSLYPAVTIVQPQNPTTRDLDGTQVTQEHGWSGSIGDEMLSSPGDQASYTVHHTTSSDLIPISPSFAHAIDNQLQIIDPCPFCSYTEVQLQDNNGGCADFIGCGGTKLPSFTLFKIAQSSAPIVSGFFDLAFTPSGSDPFITRIFACGIYPCSSPFSKFSVLELPGISGTANFVEVYHPDLIAMDTTFGGGELYLSPTVDRVRAGNSTAFTEIQSGFNGAILDTINSSGHSTLTVFPTLTTLAQCDSAFVVCTHMTQTNTSFAFDAPIAVSGTGAGYITYGPGTFAALVTAGTCTSGIEGRISAINDSTTTTAGATIAGGGTGHVMAYCNGTNYIVL